MSRGSRMYIQIADKTSDCQHQCYVHISECQAKYRDFDVKIGFLSKKVTQVSHILKDMCMFIFKKKCTCDFSFKIKPILASNSNIEHKEKKANKLTACII